MKKIIEGYKKTLAGEIPEEWGYEELNKLVDKITDGTHKTPTYTESGIPFLRVTDIQKSEIDWNNVKYISQEEHLELIKRCNPEIGDILYSKNGTIGIPKIIDWDNEFSIFVSLCLIKMKKQESYISNKYLEQFLKSDSCMRQIRLRAKQGTVTNLHLEEIRELIIPIPTIKEQEKIASILSTVDEQIDNVDILIEKNKELKKGLMQTLLTKGIGHTKFKKTEIGEIPEEWGVEKLGNIVEVISGATPKTNINEYWDNGDIYWATPTDITSNGKYISITEKTITESGLKNCSAKLLPIGSILMSSRATIGERCINTVPMATNQGFKSLVCKARVNNEFIYYYIDILKEKLIGLASGSTFLEVSKKVVEDVKVAVPSLEEQEKIVSILSEIDDKIHEYENKKQKLEELKKGLMQQLLTGKMRVDLSV